MAGKLLALTRSLLNEPQFITSGGMEGVRDFLEDRNTSMENLSEISKSLLAGEGGRSKTGSVENDSVATLKISGPLSHKATFFDALCGASSYESMAKRFDSLVSNKIIETIVLDIDSPGGEARGCFEFAKHLRENKGNKRLIARTDSLAASAAYAIASAADEIIVSSDASVGSIGVISQMVSYTGKLEKDGISVETFTAGKGKDLGNPTRDMTDEERELYQDKIDSLYNGFVSHVAEMRDLDQDFIKKKLGAYTYSGQDAVDKGLADKVMSNKEFADYLATNLENGDGMSTKATSNLETKNSMSEINLEEFQAMKDQLSALMSEKEELAKQVELNAQKEKAAQLADLKEKASAEAFAQFGVDATAYAEAAMAGAIPVEMFDAVVEKASAELSAVKESAEARLDASAALEELGTDEEADDSTPAAQEKNRMAALLKAEYNK